MRGGAEGLLTVMLAVMDLGYRSPRVIRCARRKEKGNCAYFEPFGFSTPMFPYPPPPRVAELVRTPFKEEEDEVAGEME